MTKCNIAFKLHIIFSISLICYFDYSNIMLSFFKIALYCDTLVHHIAEYIFLQNNAVNTYEYYV